MSESPASFEIVIPTKNRPAKLGRCLAAVTGARKGLELPDLVCDSSDDERHSEALKICSEHRFASLQRHFGDTVGAARNVCIKLASGDVLIGVDDDIRVESDAIEELIERYEECQSPARSRGASPGTGSTPVRS
ncbi:MAG TPA: glycosyltransferase [Solirubrobacterales bacterium]|nr:glycosyltransferase [Solirubrobacterales bacterium]